MEEKKDYIKKIFDLAKLSLTFAKVNRVTHHEDGIRNESDTDHTFMLSLIACSLADSFYKGVLDVGLVSQFALIHDLVEVYAGDTNTFLNNSIEARKEKQKREQKSFERIQKEFSLEFPYIHRIIERYDAQDCKEARFVKFIDKILPEITHILSNFSYIKNSGESKDYYLKFHDEKYEKLKEFYYDDFKEVFTLYKEIYLMSKNLYTEIIN